MRDVLFIDDLLDAYDLAVTNIDIAAGHIYNIGGGPANTLSVWMEFGPMLTELIGHEVNVTFEDWRPGDQQVYVSDIRKIRKELGWEPKVGVQEGVSRLFQWVQDHLALFDQL